MWLLKDSPCLFTDLYELTMAQAYFKKGFTETASFEVTVRRLPENWGFFVMAGLAEVESYLKEFKFTPGDMEYLQSIEFFSDDFLSYLVELRPEVRIRALAEGTVFFPHEPVFEVTGPLIVAQLLESYILNILGFSIIEATVAVRLKLAAGDIAVVDFGLRRAQGPVASVRSARAAQMAGFAATSNVFAARALDFAASGTMAHSFVEVHRSEEEAFKNFIELYGQNAILLVDTYDTIDGIKKAAMVAKQVHREKALKVRGIRIDSGDLVELSRFARQHFQREGVGFLKIFVSGDLDEFKISELLEAGAEIDGIGIGTNFAVSVHAPAIGIIYKLIEYSKMKVFKTSPDKQTRPGRKSITRIGEPYYIKDTVILLKEGPSDLLRPFESAEPVWKIQERLAAELSCLDDSIKALKDPAHYIVEFES